MEFAIQQCVIRFSTTNNHVKIKFLSVEIFWVQARTLDCTLAKFKLTIAYTRNALAHKPELAPMKLFYTVSINTIFIFNSNEDVEKPSFLKMALLEEEKIVSENAQNGQQQLPRSFPTRPQNCFHHLFSLRLVKKKERFTVFLPIF